MSLLFKQGKTDLGNLSVMADIALRSAELQLCAVQAIRIAQS
jgi:hypothetical protein